MSIYDYPPAFTGRWSELLDASSFLVIDPLHPGPDRARGVGDSYVVTFEWLP